MIRMASVEQALALIASEASARVMGVETVPLADSYGRRLAAPVIAQVSQPPADVSAMDGYAVRFADMKVGASLRIPGESRAGKPFAGSLGPSEAVRIFTGAHIPAGADHVLIQEDARRDGEMVTVTIGQSSPANIRRAGLDFSKGSELIPDGHAMTEGAISLAAAGNAASVSVRIQPRIGVLANGDELAAPGSILAPGEVVNSIQPALLALIRRWGAIALDLGVAKDTEADVRMRLNVPCNVVVSIGGASVGDYDVVRSAFAADGFAPVFEKVAVKPGKPSWFSQTAERLALGLPGNPAAAMVTAQLFLRPLIEGMTAAAPEGAFNAHAFTADRLPATGNREEYLRAFLSITPAGHALVKPAENQDSSLLSPFLTANALIRRPANAPAVPAGTLVEIVTMK